MKNLTISTITVLTVSLFLLLSFRSNSKEKLESSLQFMNGVCGIVVYNVGKDGVLEGKWSLPEYAGKIGKEIARGDPGKLSGAYNTMIYDPSGKKIFGGTLTIMAVGKKGIYQLTWIGEATYMGIGMEVGDDKLAEKWDKRGLGEK